MTKRRACREAGSERFLIRRLWAFERRRLIDHLCRLSREDRRLRFGHEASDAEIEQYCGQLDFITGAVFGVFEDGHLIASGILAPFGGDMMFEGAGAIAVERAQQRSGLGTLLTRRILNAARNRLIIRVYMLCLRENDGMRRIAEKLGGDIVNYRDETECLFRPGGPTPVSLLSETVQEGVAIGRTITGYIPFLRPGALTFS